MLDKIRVWFAVRKSKQLLKYLRGSPWLYDQVRKELESCYNQSKSSVERKTYAYLIDFWKGGFPEWPVEENVTSKN